VLVPDLIVADEALDDFGNNARFLLAHEFGIQFAPAIFVAVVDRDIKTGDGVTIGGSGAGRRQEGEAPLSGLFRQKNAFAEDGGPTSAVRLRQGLRADSGTQARIAPR
jgi:hypothetical protein